MKEDKNSPNKLNTEQAKSLLSTFQSSFESNMPRHEGLEWDEVQSRLEADPQKLWSLNEMESTGGEPDVVAHDRETDEVVFFDCSEQSPEGRRSLCYDQEALEARKKFPPDGSAMTLAGEMGILLKKPLSAGVFLCACE